MVFEVYRFLGEADKMNIYIFFKIIKVVIQQQSVIG